MAPHIPAELSSFVRERAGDVCEYCRLPQTSQEATFHIDHIMPRQVGGETHAENLALACVTCSLKKAARTSVLDDRTGEVVSLFHPRVMKWEEHFAWTVTWQVHGLTSTGRATATALGMNRPAIISIRALLAEAGGFPTNRSIPEPDG